jgi:hypothetical protein
MVNLPDAIREVGSMIKELERLKEVQGPPVQLITTLCGEW